MKKLRRRWRLEFTYQRCFVPGCFHLLFLFAGVQAHQCAVRYSDTEAQQGATTPLPLSLFDFFRTQKCAPINLTTVILLFRTFVSMLFCLLITARMMDETQIKLNFLKPNHLVDHDLKMILGMVWAIILDYQIKGILLVCDRY